MGVEYAQGGILRQPRGGPTLVKTLESQLAHALYRFRRKADTLFLSEVAVAYLTNGA
jgi:hypothetical protein